MEKNSCKTESIRTLGKVNIEEIRKKLATLSPDEWNKEEDFFANYNKQGNIALQQTRHIVFKFSNKQHQPFTYQTLSRWEKWKDILFPIMQESVKTYNYKNGYFPRVMLANLPSGCFIGPHTDGNTSGSVPHKIHIPLVTHKKCYFFLEGERFHLKEGIAYEVNNSKKHAVANGSDSDRIHLIFEYLDFDIQSPETQKQMNLGIG